jgi:hypothetical protein
MISKIWAEIWHVIEKSHSEHNYFDKLNGFPVLLSSVEIYILHCGEKGLLATWLGGDEIEILNSVRSHSFPSPLSVLSFSDNLSRYVL